MAGRPPRETVDAPETQAEAVRDEAPAVAITDTPEFALAVQSAVEKAVGPILERVAQMHALPVDGSASDSQSLFRQLALAIAEVSDQGTNRKRVAPEILAARAKAHARMVTAILEAKRAHDEDDAERPLYRAVGKMYLNERFIEPYVMDPKTKAPKAVEFYWSGPPNPVMRPLNAPASEIYRHYSDSIGNVDPEAASAALWVTAGGLVIKGDGPQSLRTRPHAALPAFDDDLKIVDNNDPEAPFIAVLGSVHPPARRGGGSEPRRGV